MNLAKDAGHVGVLREHSSWLPKVNLPPVPGSAKRILERKDGAWYWEGNPIRLEELED